MGSTYPNCKNTRYPHKCHPHYARKYGGYCLECANAGLPDIIEQAKNDALERAAKVTDEYAASIYETPRAGLEWATAIKIAARIRELKTS